MSNRSKGSIAAIVLGGLALVSVLGFAYYYLFANPLAPNTSGKKTIGDIGRTNSLDKQKTFDEEEDNDDEENESDKPKTTQAKKSIPGSPTPKVAPAVVVEDASDTESEDEDEEDDEESNATDAKKAKEEEEARMKALKQEYDDLVRLATKLLKGEAFSRAAEKFSEAIDLASKIPSAAKDILTLYNNRSAMYERSNEFDKALGDIMVVLTMEPTHLKARTRRARIYEQQKKYRECFYDYIFGLIVEQSQGKPASNAAKIDEVCRILAKEKSVEVLAKIRNSSDRALPSRVYCKNYLETNPSWYIWKEKFASIDRNALMQTLSENPESLAAHLDVICYDLVMGSTVSVFESLESNVQVIQLISKIDENSDIEVKRLASLYTELVGTSWHLRCGLDKARTHFTKAIELNSDNFEAKLKLASLHIELGELNSAEAMYHDVIQHLSSEQLDGKVDDVERSANLSWALIHRASLWISKDDNGKYPENALEKAMGDIDLALDITRPIMNNAVAKAAHSSALIKSVHILSQTKQQMGIQPSEADQLRIRESIQLAKTLFPENETVHLLEADFKTTEGDMQGALTMIDETLEMMNKARNGAPEEDSIPYVIKANILSQKAIWDLQSSGGNPLAVHAAQMAFKEIGDLYEKALSIESNCVEGFAQYANFKTMTSDVSGAVALLEKALPMARSKDEVLELCTMLEMCTAQMKAINELQAMHGMRY